MLSDASLIPHNNDIAASDKGKLKPRIQKPCNTKGSEAISDDIYDEYILDPSVNEILDSELVRRNQVELEGEEILSEVDIGDGSSSLSNFPSQEDPENELVLGHEDGEEKLPPSATQIDMDIDGINYSANGEELDGADLEFEEDDDDMPEYAVTDLMVEGKAIELHHRRHHHHHKHDFSSIMELNDSSLAYLLAPKPFTPGCNHFKIGEIVWTQIPNPAFQLSNPSLAPPYLMWPVQIVNAWETSRNDPLLHLLYRFGLHEKFTPPAWSRFSALEDEVDVLNVTKKLQEKASLYHKAPISLQGVPDKLLQFKEELTRRFLQPKTAFEHLESLPGENSAHLNNLHGDGSDQLLEQYTPLVQNVVIHYVLKPLPLSRIEFPSTHRHLDRTYDEAINDIPTGNRPKPKKMSADPSEFIYRPSHALVPFVAYQPSVSENVTWNKAVLQAIHASVSWAVPESRRFWWKDMLHQRKKTESIPTETSLCEPTPVVSRSASPLFDGESLSQALSDCLTEVMIKDMDNLHSDSEENADSTIKNQKTFAWNETLEKLTGMSENDYKQLTISDDSGMLSKLDGYELPPWVLHRYVRINSDTVTVPIDCVRFGTELITIGDLIRLRYQGEKEFPSEDDYKKAPSKEFSFSRTILSMNTKPRPTDSENNAPVDDGFNDEPEQQEYLHVEKMVFCSFHGAEALPFGTAHRTSSVKIFGSLWKRVCRPGQDALYKFKSRIDRSYPTVLGIPSASPQDSQQSVYDAYSKSYDQQIERYMRNVSLMSDGLDANRSDAQDNVPYVNEPILPANPAKFTFARSFYWQVTGETRVVDLRTEVAGKYYPCFPYIYHSFNMSELGMWDPNENVPRTSPATPNLSQENATFSLPQQGSKCHNPKSLYHLMKDIRIREHDEERWRQVSEVWSDEE